VRNAVTQIKRWPISQADGFEKAIRAALEAGGRSAKESGVDRFMSWDQVAQLPRDSQVSVGSHGCSHTPLVALAPETAATELRVAREQIHAKGAGVADSIAYPNGDHNDHVIASARKAGYRIGFTTDKGVVSSEDDPLRLRRINVHEAGSQTMPEFLCAMLLIFHRLRRPPPPQTHARSSY
jgi:peptidoglycan/xylan/chitin deacetylase (PgdA/CDA1 family)